MKLKSLAIASLISLNLFVLHLPAMAQMMQASSGESAQPTVGYDQVQPILRKRCQNCHNPEELRGDLSVSDFASISTGGSSGPVVVAGEPRESLLYTTAAHLDEPTMPPNSRKIPAREIEIIKRWIEDGLVLKSGDLPKKKSAQGGVESGKMEADPGQADVTSGFEPVRQLLQASSIPCDCSTTRRELGGNCVRPTDRLIGYRCR